MDREQLAGSFFLIAHDGLSGRSRISHELLGCGLVAAQLARLVIARSLDIVADRVVVTPEGADDRPGHGADHDEIDAFVVEGIRRQSQPHRVRAWVRSLADVLYELHGGRLVSEGVVHREQAGGLVRRREDRFPAVDPGAASGPRRVLESMIADPRELDLQGAFTVALLWAMGLDALLDPELDRTTLRVLVEQIDEHLPAELAAVLVGARAAAAGLSLAIRP